MLTGVLIKRKSLRMTIFEAYNSTKKQLEAAGLEDYVFEAKQIIKHITGLSNTEILMRYTTPLTLYQQNNLTAIIKQRIARYPLQYIFGSWGFYGRNYKVGPGVLTPRADTETVIDVALKYLKDKSAPEILDLCSGSGCIGITLAAECSSSRVTLVEKYQEALRYARENSLLNGTENVTCLQGDIYESVAADKKYDLIVSNPPYIPADEMETVSPETKYEPETALYGGEDGLTFYRAITQNYNNSLKKGGMMIFEVGIGESEAVCKILEISGFENIGCENDLNGIQRVVFGTVKNI